MNPPSHGCPEDLDPGARSLQQCPWPGVGAGRIAVRARRRKTPRHVQYGDDLGARPRLSPQHRSRPDDHLDGGPRRGRRLAPPEPRRGDAPRLQGDAHLAGARAGLWDLPVLDGARYRRLGTRPVPGSRPAAYRPGPGPRVRPDHATPAQPRIPCAEAGAPRRRDRAPPGLQHLPQGAVRWPPPLPRQGPRSSESDRRRHLRPAPGVGAG